MQEFIFRPKNKFLFSGLNLGYNFEPIMEFNSKKYISFTESGLEDSYIFHCTLESPSTKEVKIQYSAFKKIKKNDYEVQESIETTLKSKIKSRMEFYLGINDDYSDFYKFVTSIDEISEFKDLIPEYRLSTVVSTEWMPIFAYLTTNTTVKMYHDFVKEFKENWGNKYIFNKNSRKVLPNLIDFVHLNEEDFRKTKVGFRAKYLPGIIEYFSRNKFQKSLNVDQKKYLKQILEVKGIGDYTARASILYGMKRHDVGFVDSFVKILMKKYFDIDKKTSNKKILEFINKKFYPYQGLVIDWLTGVYRMKNPRL